MSEIELYWAECHECEHRFPIEKDYKEAETKYCPFCGACQSFAVSESAEYFG